VRNAELSQGLLMSAATYELHGEGGRAATAPN